MRARAQGYVAENPRTSGLAIAGAVLVLAGIGVGIFFLVRFFGQERRPNSDSEAHGEGGRVGSSAGSSAGSWAFGAATHDDTSGAGCADACRCRGSAETRSRRCGGFGRRSSRCDRRHYRVRRAGLEGGSAAHTTTPFRSASDGIRAYAHGRGRSTRSRRPAGHGAKLARSSHTATKTGSGT